VTNDGVGDLARVIRDYHVGVLATLAATWIDLLDLLQDPDLAFRCRRVAEGVLLCKLAPLPMPCFMTV
jgi:hypothetical protein